jgi:hypothetical protein
MKNKIGRFYEIPRDNVLLEFLSHRGLAVHSLERCCGIGCLVRTAPFSLA